ncbi:hypothetical protein [Ureibacillus manganicus]|nr:hypothetical protein [Ureibacillus manganicus]
MVTTGGSRIPGKTHQIGIDYVDVKSSKDTIVTVLRDKIDHVRWYK